MSSVHDIKDQAVKTLIYFMQQDIANLKHRLEMVEKANLSTDQVQPIGFHVKGGEKTLETAFKNPIRNIGD